MKASGGGRIEMVLLVSVVFVFIRASGGSSSSGGGCNSDGREIMFHSIGSRPIIGVLK